MNRHVRRVLLVFLNTGGGHRSTAHAVAETLTDLYADRVQVDLVDVTTHYFPWPLSELDAIYRWMVRLHGWPWALAYHLTDGPRRLALLRGAWWLLTGRSVLALLEDHPADVVVCCHPLLKAPCGQALALRGPGTPLITLVTDLASAHATWFVGDDECCLVATEPARERARACGLPDESVHAIGLPVRPCFIEAARRDPIAVRHQLGLDPDGPVVLLMGGADGVGSLLRLAKAISDRDVQAQLAVITGRNQGLRRELESRAWAFPLRIQGFVHNVEDWMGAADLVVTKAGPSTVSEALVMGLPMVLSGALPGQERPNADYVVERGAGVWAPTPAEAARAVYELLSTGSSTLTGMTECARALARPDAARRAAQVIWEAAGGQLAW